MANYQNSCCTKDENGNPCEYKQGHYFRFNEIQCPGGSCVKHTTGIKERGCSLEKNVIEEKIPNCENMACWFLF